MKILKFDNKEEWLEARKGKITGTRLKDLVVKKGTGKKIGYYEMIAEKIALPSDGEDAMARGERLEGEAIAFFAKETGKKIDTSLVIWTRDEENDIALSPDGIIGKTEAIEVKCLSSARYLEALLTQKIPDEYEFQKLQYFIVNDSLKTLYFAFYDPRVVSKPFFYITVNRKDIEKEIEEYLKYQKDILEKINRVVLELTF